MLRLISTLVIIDASPSTRFNISKCLLHRYDRAMLDACSLCGSWASRIIFQLIEAPVQSTLCLLLVLYVIYQGGSEQQCQVEHQLVFMKLLNSGTKGRITMEKVLSFAVTDNICELTIGLIEWCATMLYHIFMHGHFLMELRTVTRSTWQ